MKKNTIYLSVIVLFIAAIIGIAYKYNKSQKEKESTVYELLDRKGEANTTKEFIEVKKKATALLTAVQTNPSDTKSTLKLAALL